MASSKTPAPGEPPAQRSSEMPAAADTRNVHTKGDAKPRTIEGENFLAYYIAIKRLK